MGSDLPARMIEAAAAALYAYEGGDGPVAWADASPGTREAYQEQVRPTLAAPLRVLDQYPHLYDLADIADEIEGGA